MNRTQVPAECGLVEAGVATASFIIQCVGWQLKEVLGPLVRNRRFPATCQNRGLICLS
jgi:hypothetical protein